MPALRLNFSSRFKNLAKQRNLTAHQLAEVFGVDHQTMYSWWSGATNPRVEFRNTLVRLESDPRPAISPRVPEWIAKKFGASA